MLKTNAERQAIRRLCTTEMHN